MVAVDVRRVIYAPPTLAIVLLGSPAGERGLA